MKISKFIPDKLFLRIAYRYHMGKTLDLKNPKTFTEKLQWLKLYNRKPEYTQMVDKILAKEYVSGIIGEAHVIPTLFVWDDVEQIDINELPEKFVIKCNHYGGGSVFICKDKSNFDFIRMKKVLRKQLKNNLYWSSREWPYKNIKVKIFCEPYLEDSTGELRDYKFYCFDGEVKVCLVASNRFTSHNFTYYDMNFMPLNIQSVEGERSLESITKPTTFEEMKKIASMLSKGIPHVRVDLYDVYGTIYFGELTFFDSSGYDDMNSDEWNRKFGDWIKLPDRSN